MILTLVKRNNSYKAKLEPLYNMSQCVSVSGIWQHLDVSMCHISFGITLWLIKTSWLEVTVKICQCQYVQLSVSICENVAYHSVSVEVCQTFSVSQCQCSVPNCQSKYIKLSVWVSVSKYKCQCVTVSVPVYQCLSVPVSVCQIVKLCRRERRQQLQQGAVKCYLCQWETGRAKKRLFYILFAFFPLPLQHSNDKLFSKLLIFLLRIGKRMTSEIWTPITSLGL